MKYKGRIVRHHGATADYLESLKLAGVAHSTSITNNTTIVKIPRPNGEVEKWLISDRRLPLGALGFIGRVKKAANYVADQLGEPVPRRPVSYWKTFMKQGGTFTNAIEVDVNSAYWEIAHQKGYIPTDIYEEGKTVDKVTRLVAFGALATVRVHYEYRPDIGQNVWIGETKNDITRSFFFDVAHELGELMQGAIKKVGRENMYFYWVDAFFVTEQAAEAIEEHFAKFGLGVKRKLIDKMTCERLHEGWKVEVHEKKEKTTEVKPFFFPFEDSRKRLLNLTRDLQATGMQYKTER